MRGVDGEDLSHILARVVFKLHDSFADSAGGVNRGVTAHPFEVEEGGWGEFTIGITVHFVDPDEPPVELQHYLKLDMSLEEGNKHKPVSECTGEAQAVGSRRWRLGLGLGSLLLWCSGDRDRDDDHDDDGDHSC